MIPPVGLCQIRGVVATQVAVPAKYCSWSWHSIGSYCVGPERKKFPVLFRGEVVDTYFLKILGHSVMCGGLCILDPQSSSESTYNTSKADSGELVGSFLGGTALNYVGYRDFVHRSSVGSIKEQRYLDIAYLARQK